MTRGMKGCYVYCVNSNLANYLKEIEIVVRNYTVKERSVKIKVVYPFKLTPIMIK